MFLLKVSADLTCRFGLILGPFDSGRSLALNDLYRATASYVGQPRIRASSAREQHEKFRCIFKGSVAVGVNLDKQLYE